MSALTRTRYPGYDVLAKRETPSWDSLTRRVIAERVAPGTSAQFFNAIEWNALSALCDCIVPQRQDTRSCIPVPMLVDAKVAANKGDGFRHVDFPPIQQAWRTGLAALDAEARTLDGLGFASVESAVQLDLLKAMQRGHLHDAAWNGMSPEKFFSARVLHDICSAYYGHPDAWSEIGFGGPANPRGYVRMYFDRRDPWEGVESDGTPSGDAQARKENTRVR